MFFQKIKAVFEWISARRMKQSRKVLDYPWTTHQSIRHNPTPTESSASGSGRAEPERTAAAAQTAAPAASAAPTTPESAESAAPQSKPAAAKRTRAAKGTTTAKKSAAPTTPAAAEEKPKRARKTTKTTTAAKTTKMAKAAKTAKMPEKSAENPAEKPAEEPAATVAATDAVPAPEVKTKAKETEIKETEAKEAKEAKSPAAPARRTRRTHPKPPAGTLPWGEEEEKLSGLRVTSLRGGAKRRVTADSPGADFLVGRSLKELRTMVQERFPEAAAIGRASKFAFWLDSHREGREFLAEKLEGTVRRRGRPPKATTEDKAKK